MRVERFGLSLNVAADFIDVNRYASSWSDLPNTITKVIEVDRGVRFVPTPGSMTIVSIAVRRFERRHTVTSEKRDLVGIGFSGESFLGWRSEASRIVYIARVIDMTKHARKALDGPVASVLAGEFCLHARSVELRE